MCERWLSITNHQAKLLCYVTQSRVTSSLDLNHTNSHVFLIQSVTRGWPGVVQGVYIAVLIKGRVWINIMRERDLKKMDNLGSMSYLLRTPCPKMKGPVNDGFIKMSRSLLACGWIRFKFKLVLGEYKGPGSYHRGRINLPFIIISELGTHGS